MSNDEDREMMQRAAGEKESAKLWRAWRTAHQMVRDRGYNLTEQEVNISLKDFKNKFMGGGAISRTEMHFSAVPSDEMRKRYSNPVTPQDPHPSAPDIGSIYVQFIGDSTIGVKHMRNFVQQLTTDNHHTGILVTNVNISPSALKIIPAVAQHTRVECFVEQDLLVNITHHELVPKHVLLSKEERTALLARYRLKDTQLPRIQVGDPVARYLGLRRGQVVKIIRKSETAGRYASYRLTV